MTKSKAIDWDALYKKHSPNHTCPASRHVGMISEILRERSRVRSYLEGRQIDPDHWAGSMEATVAALWEARAEIERFNDRPWPSRASIARHLAALDGITLHEVRSTLGPPEDANNWREYLGRTDDLFAMIRGESLDV